ncbi:DMT family transporter [Virgibacillus oceani]|uniref:Multidrug resistance protein YkkC n=1 Tax=Virgibacillus oceani TaxID=1479511 RepID=A0A917H3F5_9BACI|nr:multidrug efflux SMR transporter [Virgibacillus oceani]GGG66720.1 multidrug resistance protein YkkC [Virgibacillus oceani]
MKRNWNLVFAAGLFEIGWVIGLKHAYNWGTWVLTAIAIYMSMHLLIAASRKLPVGTTYAVFTGMGTAGTVVFEIAVFNEPFNLTKVLLIVLLLCGVIGLKTITKETSNKGEGA